MTSLGLQIILPLRVTVMSGSSLSIESLVAIYVTGVGSLVKGVPDFFGPPSVFGNLFGGIFTGAIFVGFSFAFSFSVSGIVLDVFFSEVPWVGFVGGVFLAGICFFAGIGCWDLGFFGLL